MQFLLEREPRPLSMQAPAGIRPADIFVGPGGMALEVAVLEADHKPTVSQLRELHRERLGFTTQPLPGPASLLLSMGSKPAAAVFLERPDEIERLRKEALRQLGDATLKHYRALRRLA